MDLIASEEQAMLRETVRRFMADRFDASNMARELMAPADWRALAELGLFAFLLPEAAGGMGGGAADVMIVAEEFGRALAISSLAGSVVLCGQLLGTSAVGQGWGQRIAAGEATLAFACGGTVSEGRVTGPLGIVPDAAVADAIVVALDDGGVVLIDAAVTGITRSPVRLVDGSMAADVSFEGAQVSRLDADDADLARALALAELAIASELIGAMSTLLDYTLDYVKQRRQFGHPIGSFQVIQHRCARMYTLLELARSMVLKAALVEADLREHTVTCAKAYVGDAALQLAEDAVQLHGGMGVTDELLVGRALRRVLLLSRMFGGSAAARAELAG